MEFRTAFDGSGRRVAAIGASTRGTGAAVAPGFMAGVVLSLAGGHTAA